MSVYVSVADMRDIGIPDPPDDDTVQAALDLSEQLFERATRNWFEERTLEFQFDGTNSDAIHFGVAIIDIEWLRINGSDENLDATLYKVYKERQYPDDRRNPRIKLERGTVRDIYTAPLEYGDRIFRKGRQNQSVRGTFGFLEPDGSTPLPVIESIKRMTVERLAKPPYGSNGIVVPPAGGVGGGPVVEEWTDGHKIKFATAPTTARRPGLSGISSDQFVLDTIKLYRAPIGIATAAGWSHS